MIPLHLIRTFQFNKIHMYDIQHSYTYLHVHECINVYSAVQHGSVAHNTSLGMSNL